METSKNKELSAKIQYLNRKRIQHQIMIDKLVGKISEQSISSVQSLSAIRISRSSEISHQANFLTHLQSHREQQMPFEERDLLGESLQTLYEGCKFVISPVSCCRSGWLYSENSVDFELIAEYLKRNSLWEDIFGMDEFGYFARLQNDGLQKRINLSNTQLLQQEQCLLIENQQQSLQQKTICIGLLLLYRTLSSLKIGQAPKILQIFFGYPYKTYNICQTKQYFEFIQYLQQIVKIPQQNTIIYGRNTINSRLIQLPLRKIPFKPDQLLKKVQKIIIIESQDFCLRKIDLTHKKNHHVVIDVENCISGEYLLTFYSCLQGSNDSQEQSSKQQAKFRVCVVDSLGQIVCYSSNFVPNRENIRVNFEENQQYKIYVSCITQQNEQDKTKFSIVFQSHCSLHQCDINVKFNEQYNEFTYILTQRFLQTFHVNEVQKQMLRLSHLNSQTDVLIVRCMLNFMGIIVDFVSIPDITRIKPGMDENEQNLQLVIEQHAKREIGKKSSSNPINKDILLEYKGRNVLCDRQFTKNVKKLKFQGCSIKKVILSKDCQIVKITPQMTYCFSKIFI